MNPKVCVKVQETHNSQQQKKRRGGKKKIELNRRDLREGEKHSIFMAIWFLIKSDNYRETVPELNTHVSNKMTLDR